MELTISPEEAQFIAELKGSGLSLPEAVAGLVNKRSAVRDFRAKGEADVDAEDAVGISKALKAQMNRIVTRYLGKAEGEEFARTVNHVDLALESDNTILAASSAYNDISTDKQCTEEQYKAYLGCGVLLHAPTTFAAILASVGQQLSSLANIEFSSAGKLKYKTRLAQFMLGQMNHISNADFDTNPLLNGGPMTPLLKQIMSMGPQFHETHALGVVKKSENFTFAFTKNGLAAPAESVAAVNGTFYWVVMRAQRNALAV
jgi:hypothetical protein